MPHAFDTGLAAPQRTVIREGVVQLLSGLLIANGGYLQAVVRWGGIIRGYTDDLGIDQLHAALQGRSPAIAVALGDRSSEAAGMGGYNWKADLELVLYHYSKHPRGLELGRLSADAVALGNNLADPGLDVQLEHAEELVVGQRCGGSATIKQVVPTREEEVRTENAFTLWAQRYSIILARKINAYRTVDVLLAELRSQVRTTDPEMASPAPPLLEVQSLTDP